MSLVNELKRRNVFKVGATYLIVAWLIAQIADLALESFAAPAWVIKTVLFLLAIGFPVALLFAWAFELTPDGVRREQANDHSQQPATRSNRTFVLTIAGLLVLAGTFLIVERSIIDDRDAEPLDVEQVIDELIEPALEAEMSFPLPDKPSIVVLPFDNMSGDPEQEYFVDGITEDLTTDLSKLPGLFVIARNSAFVYKNTPVLHKQVAEELGVRYILEGSVRRVGERIRINAQCIDALTGLHIWAERYDRSLADVFALQDSVVQEIVAALAASVPGAAETHETAGGTTNPKAYIAALHGWDHQKRQTLDDGQKALAYFEQAVELDPDYGLAYAGLSRVYWDATRLWWVGERNRSWQQSFDLARINLELAMREPSIEAYTLSAEINARLGQFDAAMADINEAITLGPSIADTSVAKAQILNAIGHADEAETLVRDAMRLDPHFRPEYLRVLAISLLHQEQYADALQYMELATSRQTSNPYDYVTLTALYGYLDRTEDAQVAINHYQELSLAHEYSTPLTVQETEKWWYGDMFDYDRAYTDRLLEGLRKAGLPEGPVFTTAEFDYRHLMSRDDEILNVEGVPSINVETAFDLWDGGAVFIDVRDSLAFNAGHVPGAINLDLHVDFSEHNLNNYADQNNDIVMSCWGEDCPYAAHASAIAVTWGYKNVFYFAGGYNAWQVAGHPVEDRNVTTD